MLARASKVMVLMALAGWVVVGAEGTAAQQPVARAAVQPGVTGPQAMTLHVRRAAPHRVLRQELAGVPIVIELQSVADLARS